MNENFLTNSATEYKRKMLKEKLDQCTDPQISMFNRMYGDISQIEDSKMNRAYEQVCLTLDMNKEKQS